MLQPPEGSRIRVESTPAGPRIFIPQPRPHWMLYYMRAFLVVWLGLWMLSQVFIARDLLAGPSEQGRVFDLTFAIGWFCAGLLVIGGAIRIWRPAVAETLVVGRSSLVWHSGMAPFVPRLVQGRRPDHGWKRGFFGRAVEEEFSLRELETLALREHPGWTSLTIDRGFRRIEIGLGASAEELEWLYAVLLDEYRLRGADA